MKKKIIICLSVAMCMLLTIGFAAQNYLSAEEETISVMIRAKNNISAQTFSADAQEETAGEITVEDIAPSELGDLKENPNVFVEPNSKVVKSTLADNWYLDYDNISAVYDDLTVRGQNVKIAVLDTGISGDGFSTAGGINILDTSGDYIDNNGHGSAMANIIHTIAPEAQLYSVKVLDETGTGYYSDVISGINWAVENDMDIICMSFGSYEYSYFLEEAVNNAFCNNIAMIAAAGNDGNENIHYPAAYNQVLSVGACDKSGNIASFSNGGDKADVYAPGVDINTADHRHVKMQGKGTSVSAAQTAGVAVLMKSAVSEYDVSKLYTVLKHAANQDENIPILNGYASMSKMNAFIENQDIYVPTLDKNVVETENGRVAISYKYDAYDYQTVSVNDPVTVRAGFYSAHDHCDITVYKSTNTSNILYSTRYYDISGDAYLTFTCPQDILTSAGTYYIRYHGSENSSTQYDDIFTVYVEDIAPDKYEPNDTFSAAYEIDRTGYRITANIGSAADKDYYKIYLNAGETIELELTNLPRDYDLALYNPSKRQVEDSVNSGLRAETITYSAAKNGYHYIYIYSFEGMCSADTYRLNYSISVPKDEYEEHKNYANITVDNNDTYDARNLLYFTNNITLTPTISYMGDVDWFQFTAPKGQVTITLEDMPYDYDLYLYTDKNTQAAKSNNGGTNAESITYEISGDYQTLYIKVTGYDDYFSILPYTLTISYNYIKTNTVQPEKNTAAVIWTTAFSGDSTVNYGTTSSVAQTKSSSAWTKNHSISLTGLSPAKQYFYKVKTTGYTSSESETASFCTKDRYEDNNTLDSATPISWAGEIFNGTIHDSNDEDYYTVSLDKTGIIYLTLEDIPADCDYDLWLADQDGNALAYSSNYGDVDEAIVYIAEPGTYYAVIECYRRYKGDAPYSFTYDFEPLNLNSAEVIDELHYGGDGVYSATGNYSKTFSDLNFTNTAYDYYIGRTYNSKDQTNKHFGRGWIFSFEGKVNDLERTFEYSNGNIGTYTDENYKMVKLPDGRVYIFEKQSNGTFQAQDSRATLVKNGTGYLFTAKDKSKYFFNDQGILTSMEDKYGNTMTITVNTDGKVQSFTDPTQNQYTVAYGENGYISDITETATGRNVSYQYTGDDLTTVVDAAGIITHYAYDTDHYLTAIKNDQEAALETLTYTAMENEPKKISTLTDMYGNNFSYTYESTENKTIITDSNGRTTAQSYDEKKFITSILDQAGRTKTIQYTLDEAGKNKYGEEAAITDENGNTFTYIRDENGNITKETKPDGTYKDYFYDSNNNLIWERDSTGNFIRYEYDSKGIQMTKKARYLEKVSENQVVELNSENYGLFAVEEYIYYPDAKAKIKGLLQKCINADGIATEYDYDGNGNPISVKDPQTGLSTAYTYNTLNYKLTRTTPRGYTTQYMYDNAGNLVKETDTTDGAVRRIVYDVNGRKTLEINPEQYDASADYLNAAENINSYSVSADGAAYEYYPNGLLKKETSPEGDVKAYTYDLYGNVTTETLPSQYDVTGNRKLDCGQYIYEYDNLNRMTAKKYKETPDAESVLLESTVYSVEQNTDTGEFYTVRSITKYYSPENSSATVYKSNYDDKTVFVGYDNGSTEHFSYYPDGELKSYTDGNENTVHYRYDSFDNVKNVTYDEVWSPAEGGYSYARIDYSLNGDKAAEYKSADIVELYAVPENLYVKNYSYYANGLLKTEADTEGRKTEYEYDADGNTAKVSVYRDETNKNVTEFVNNHKGHVITETKHVSTGTFYGDERTSLVTAYTYDLNGNKISVTAPDGAVTSYVYDKKNRLISTSQFLTNEDGIIQNAVVEQQYNCNDEPYFRKDALGNTTRYVYDNRGFCIKEVDALGGTVFNVRDYAGRITNTVKPRFYNASVDISEMNRTELVYNSRDWVIRQTEHYDDGTGEEEKDVTVKEYTYDNNGNVLTEADALGNITRYTYTPSNHLKTRLDQETFDKGLEFSVKFSYNGMYQQVSEYNSAGVRIDTEYNTRGQVLRKTVISGADIAVLERNTYDGAGNRLSEMDANGNTTSYTYNELNAVQNIVYPHDESIPENTVSQKYGLNSKAAYETDSLGKEILYSYDEAGRLVATTVQSANSSPLTVYTKYDLNGNKRREIDGAGNVTENTFDALNHITSAVKAGKSTSYTYDANSNLVSTTDWLGNTTATEYDALDRVCAEYDAYGKAVSRKQYNANGVQISNTDALGAVTSYEYDKNNRLVKTIDPNNNITLKSYDNLGNVASETDANGNVKYYTYDKLNNLTSVRQTVGGVEEATGYTYDNCGNLLSQTDGNGNVTEYEYNALNLVSRKIYPGGGENPHSQESYTYYADGTLAAFTDRNGNTVSYTYDAAGRQLSQTASGLSVSSVYDGAGNKLVLADDTGNTERTYDAYGRAVSKTQPRIGTFTYTYDVTTDVTEGEFAEITNDPHNNVTKKVFDKAGRLHFVYDNAALAAKYTYYDNGALQKIEYGSGASEEYTYFSNGWLQTLVNKNSSGEVTDSYSYTYDANGNQTSKNEIIGGINKGTTAYIYDEQNRLKSVLEPSGRQTVYTYDKAGNRLSETIIEEGSNIVTNYIYDNQNRLIATLTIIDGAKIRYDYQYDYNGNLVSKTKTVTGGSEALQKMIGMTIAGETENGVSQYAEFYEYDALNRLVKAAIGGKTSCYAYNGEGLRVQKTMDGAVTDIGYDFDNPVIEQEGTEYTVNLYGTNLVSRTAGGQKLYYQFNGHADVVALTDASGNVVASYYYDAFGVQTEQNGNAENPFRYGGYVYDEETGLYYIKSRFYDAAVARFIQEDVYTGDKKDPLSLNLYTYVVNNPLKYLDPTGRIPNEIKINGKSIGYLKGYGTGVYGSMRDIVSAYGGYISRQDNVYYAQIGDVKLTFNLKDAKIGQTYAFQAKGNKTKFDYNYFVLTEDVEQKGAVKILVNIESFVKVFSSNPNDMQKIYWNLNTFFSDINQLEAAAKDYKKNKNHSYYAQLVLQQMRKHNYDGIMWDRVAGNIDEGFTKYLKKNNKLYLSFMGDVVLYDFTTGGAVDLPHFAATLNALLYETHPTVLTGAPALGAGRSEQDVDDLAGWAGDLQSAIRDLHDYENLYKVDAADYGAVYSIAKEFIGNRGQFSQPDMLADVDAVNINAAMKYGHSLYAALRGYYRDTFNTNKVNKRYTAFINNQFHTTDKEKIRSYVNHFVSDDSTGYIFNNFKRRDITNAERRALRDAFINYIYNINSGR